MRKIEKIVIEGTKEDMNKSFEEFLKRAIPNPEELDNFKKQQDALFMLHGAFEQGRKLGLKFALDSIQKFDLYEKPLSPVKK